MDKKPVAVQMFTLREEAENDFSGALKKIAEIGFDGVEFAGYGGLSTKEVRSLLDKYDLQAAASHVPLDQLENNLDQVIQDQKVLGSKFIVCPFLLPEHRTEVGYKALIPFLEQAGETCRNEGILLCYHNHDFELDRLSDGRTALETIFDQTSIKNVQTELDVYWLKKAGEDPVKWIERYKNRAPLVHLKDMTVDDEQFFAELGTGGIDVDSILNIGNNADVQWWIVEQDKSRRTPFESIEISLNYLKTKFEMEN